MGKKRIVKKGEAEGDAAGAGASLARSPKKKVSMGTIYVQSTYNNTKLLLADKGGNALAWSSSGSIGFKGAKKGTPFAASKVGELLSDKTTIMGIKEVSGSINGVGAGREAALRAFVSKGIG